MFFSIIVPVYNVEKYLNECVDSILRQTFEDFELILVDDGSQDSSSQICDQYALQDARVNVIHQINRGQSSARNSGVEISKGKYIIFIDSDDYVESERFLSSIYEKAKTGIDIVNYKFRKYYDLEKRFDECKYHFPSLDTQMNYGDKIAEIVKHDAFYCSPWSKAVRGEVIRENHIEFLEGIVAEDQDWYYQVILNSRTIDGIDISYMVYRQRSNSVSTSWTIKNLQDCLFILEKWYKKIAEADIEASLRNAMFCSLAKLYCNLLIAYTRFDSAEKKTYEARLKDMVSLLNYDTNPRVVILKKVWRVFGYTGLMTGLNIVCRLR